MNSKRDHRKVVYVIANNTTVCKSLRRKNMSNQHITPHPNGGWQVKAENSQRATLRTETQKEAIDRGRQIAINQSSELFIHNKQGRIRERSSYGNDPFPPKG